MSVLLRLKDRAVKRVGKLKGLVRKIYRGLLQRKRYLTYLERFPVERGKVLLESQHGRSLDGNVYAVLAELCREEAYRGLTLYVSAEPKNRKRFEALLKENGLERARVLCRGSYAYFKVLATAEYLVNDNTFLYCFIKRKEQIYLNTWHGTPLKTLGKRSKSEYFSIGNAQKTFLDADYVLYPNEFTMERMIADYMVDNIGRFTPLLGGYPRNAVFFNPAAGEKLREKYGLSGKTAYAYLPTWRGTIGNVFDREQEARLAAFFKELDGKLSDDRIVYVKMHTVSSSRLSLEKFSHIRPFPKEETYAFLNAMDGLITDYSSVFFDFAVTGKKIILFPYDLEEYEKERGFYFPLSELPFPQVRTAEALFEELCSPKQYDDTAFLRKFCAYDGADAAQKLCRHVFLDKPCLKEEKLPDNGRENVLLYCGDFALNGVTVSVNNLLANVDVTKKNYIVLVKTEEVRGNAFRLLELPEGVRWLGFSNCMSLKFTDTMRFKLWNRKRSIGSYEKLRPVLEKLGTNDYQRIAGRAKIDTAVHFNGYGNHITLIMGAFPCRRVIYAHNDMDAELNTRITMKREILCNAYRTYDAVAAVTEDLIPSVEKVGNFMTSYGHAPHVFVVRNIIDYKKVARMGEEPLAFDKETESTVSPERLREILDSDAVTMINIGRFSPEKGHLRLMRQFAKLLPKYPDSYLILLGSRGTLYQDTLAEAARLNLGEHLIIIYYMSNPYALLKRCDAFVFSSFYEGFGLVLAEADILGVPCVSTDIVGPKRFMERYGGKLVENSDKGVAEALSLCMERKLCKRLGVNYEIYNKEAVGEFLQVIEKTGKAV
ncbi:MAG: CDP-glycerol glycerophosphotransferase family protein [Lachnospiraceae bacterium]|nr:CDP-glycerol glycerophosphotransferase family protein [Lachnospiraceae bacterium]